MHCMKCGVKIDDKAAFCEKCLREMEKYPVRPNTLIQLPVRSTQAVAKKKPRRRELKPEERVRLQRKVIGGLALALAVMLVAFAASAFLILTLLEERENYRNIGQNYGTIAQNSTD